MSVLFALGFCSLNLHVVTLSLLLCYLKRRHNYDTISPKLVDGSNEVVATIPVFILPFLSVYYAILHPGQRAKPGEGVTDQT